MDHSTRDEIRRVSSVVLRDAGLTNPPLPIDRGAARGHMGLRRFVQRFRAHPRRARRPATDSEARGARVR